jgi:integrase
VLTDTAVRNAKPREKPYKLSDSGALYLLISPGGSKLWRFKYRVEGKEKLLALGAYPEIPLKQARDRRDDARRLLANGVDPGVKRQVEKAAAGDTFEAIAREWFAKFSVNWATSHSEKVIRRLELDLFPWLGSRPIREVTPPELLDCLRRIEGRGAVDTAHRAHQNCGQVFRYAVATGRVERDPSADLRGALAPVKGGHFASITEPTKVAALLRAIHDYDGSSVVRTALRFTPLTFVRPGELRQAEWIEVNLDAAEWRLPAERMKSRAPHLVPLSRQAVELLREIRPLTGKGRYVFPAATSESRPMSENTINSALRRLGYSSTDMTAHGFRSMASTLLNEQGWNRDAIERQLAHGERNPVRAAYNYAEHLQERRKMMQAWADYLDDLRSLNNAQPLARVS